MKRKGTSNLIRLTKRVDGKVLQNHDYDATPADIRAGKPRWRNVSRECMTKLAAYEDSGWEPDEVARLVNATTAGRRMAFADAEAALRGNALPDGMRFLSEENNLAKLRNEPDISEEAIARYRSVHCLGCGSFRDQCQCPFSGSAHPSREERYEIVKKGVTTMTALHGAEGGSE